MYPSVLLLSLRPTNRSTNALLALSSNGTVLDSISEFMANSPWRYFVMVLVVTGPQMTYVSCLSSEWATQNFRFLKFSLWVTRSENIQNFPCLKFQQTVMFLRAIGCKKTFSIIKVCPQLILTSAFGLWVFGPVKSGFCCGGCCKRSNKISVSFGHSWINVLITGTQ